MAARELLLQLRDARARGRQLFRAGALPLQALREVQFGVVAQMICQLLHEMRHTRR
jgi:hypothetical protein